MHFTFTNAPGLIAPTGFSPLPPESERSQSLQSTKAPTPWQTKVNKNIIFLPMLLHVFTTLLAYAILRIRRNKAASAGLVNEERRALHDDAWPDNVIQINNNIRNQFEAPTLFYALCLTLWCIDFVGMLGLATATLFSLSRLAHLYIHTNSNYVPRRRQAFTFGLAMVAVMFCVASAGVLQSLKFS